MTQIGDAVDFLGGQASEGRSWLWKHISRVCANNRGAGEGRSSAEESLIVSVTAEAALPEGSSSHRAMLLRVICALGGLSGVSLHPEEAMKVLSLLKLMPDSPGLVLSFLLTSPNIARTIGMSELIQAWGRLHDGGVSEVVTYGEILMETEQLDKLGSFVQGLLGFQASIGRESLKEVTLMIREAHLGAKKLSNATLSLGMPVLKAGGTSHTLDCFRELLRSKRLQVPTAEKDWLWELILNAKEPVHPQILRLIDDYVAATLTGLVERLDAKRVKSALLGEELNAPSEILLLYTVVAHDGAVSKFKAVRAKTVAYAGDFLEALPVKRLLSLAESRPWAYGSIYPALLSLVVSQVPALFGIHSLLAEEELKGQEAQSHRLLQTSGGIPSAVFSLPPLVDPLDKNLLDIAPIISDLESGILEKKVEAVLLLSALSPEAQRAAGGSFVRSIVKEICKREGEVVDQRLVVLFPEIWCSIFILSPYELALELINATHRNGTKQSHSEVVHNPLIVLQAKPEALHNPCVFRCLLESLSLYMNSSKTRLSTALSQSSETQEAQLEELAAIVLTQDSAAIQLLLELCLERPGRGELEETRVMVMEFLHNLFIEHPLLIKLVHFQGEPHPDAFMALATLIISYLPYRPSYNIAGYEPELIPICVRGIPSMHLSLTFLPELLAHPNPRQAAFGVLLAGSLIKQYPLPNSLNVAHQVLALLSSIGPDSSLEPYVPEMLPALEDITMAFPMLMPEAAQVLAQLRLRLQGKPGGRRVLAPQLAGALDAPGLTFRRMVGVRDA